MDQQKMSIIWLLDSFETKTHIKCNINLKDMEKRWKYIIFYLSIDLWSKRWTHRENHKIIVKHNWDETDRNGVKNTLW